MVFNIHESAKKQIDKLLEESGKIDKSFRIYIRRISGWRGPVLDVSLYELTEKDELFESDGYKIFMRKEMVEKINNVEIYYQYGISKSGFRVLTDMLWKIKYRYEDWAKSINP